jgi:hypothetical protein
MQILDRDKEILRLCQTYAYVDATYLLENVFYPSNTEITISQNRYFKKRMQQLVGEQYLAKYPRVLHDYKSTSDTIYCLSHKGIAYAKANLGKGFRYSFYPNRQLSRSYNHFLAVLRISESLILNVSNSLNYVEQYHTESESYLQFGKGKHDWLRPDGLLVIRYNDHRQGTIGFFLEAERIIHQYNSTEKKLKQYSAFFQSPHYQKEYAKSLGLDIDFFSVLFIATETISYTQLKNQLLMVKNNGKASYAFKNPFFLCQESDLYALNSSKPVFLNLSSQEENDYKTIF